MKYFIFFLSMLPAFTIAQSVGIGTLTPNSSAMLDISSDAKGLLIPRLTELQKEGIASPATGLLIWQTNGAQGFYYNNGTPENPKWFMLSPGLDTDWKLTGNNNVDSATHFLGSINKAPLFFKVRNTWAGQLDSGKATFFGYKAGWQAPHRYNTAFGTEALSAPSEEEGNSAFGFLAAKENRSGDWLTAVGGFALFSNITGRKNTAIGYQTLPNNVSGDANTAVGANALFANDTGSQNTAVGSFAMQFNKAHQNTALGHSVLPQNVSGHRNTALGTFAMFENSSGSDNTAIGQRSLFYNILGNDNVAVGAYALFNNKMDYNTALGSKALYSNLNGSSNTGIGGNAMQENASGSRNTAIGMGALLSNVAGNNNTAIGTEALYNHTGGIFSSNTAVGYRSLHSTTTGYDNVAIGSSALRKNNVGESNIAIGVNALLDNTNGEKNTTVGTIGMVQLGTGNFNTGVGYHNMYGLTNGSSNSSLGYRAAVGPTATNRTAVGANAYAGCNNCLVLGSVDGVNDANANVNVGIGAINPQYRLQVGTAGDGSQARANAWNIFSDERYKTDIIPIDQALEKLDHLNGYYYQWKNGDDKTRQAGLLAQEVENVLPEIVSTDYEGYKSVDYGKMNALLLQALKEQQQLVIKLEKRVSELEKKSAK